MSVSALAVAVMLASAQTAVEDGPSASIATAAPVLVLPVLASPTLPVPMPTAAAPSDVPVPVPPPPSPPTVQPAALAAPPAPAVEEDDAIVVTASRRSIAADPLSGVNAASFEAITAIDKAVIAPVAGTYEKTVPTPVRNGLRNVLINLAEPIVFVNFLLQFKPGKAMETAGRFAINSTVGVAGLFDMAKRRPFNLPYRQNGFANTFGYHGIKSGPFLFVPILGPTSVRDLVGRVLDLSLIPAVAGSPFNRPAYGLGTGTVKAMNDRVEFDEQIVANRERADPYVATRDFYLKRRQAEIDALHSPAYRLRHGIADPVLPPIQPHVDDNAAPGSDAALPHTSIPSSTGMAPAAPAPDAPVSGTPRLSPAP